MVDCASLENWRAERFRGFESHPLRQHPSPVFPGWGVGVSGWYENPCAAPGSRIDSRMYFSSAMTAEPSASSRVLPEDGATARYVERPIPAHCAACRTSIHGIPSDLNSEHTCVCEPNKPKKPLPKDILAKRLGAIGLPPIAVTIKHRNGALRTAFTSRLRPENFP